VAPAVSERARSEEELMEEQSESAAATESDQNKNQLLGISETGA
jgi:hypothetical protein